MIQNEIICQLVMERIIGSCFLLCGALAVKAQERPDIVLFIADDVSYGKRQGASVTLHYSLA